MGIIRKYSKQLLFIIVIIQFTIIGIFAYSDNINQVLTSNDIIAIVSKNQNQYLMVRTNTDEKTLPIDSKAKYLNYKNNQVYLFDKEKQYLNTIVLNHERSEYSIFLDAGISYIETGFNCKQNICKLKNIGKNGSSKVQLFTTKGDEYVYLDADMY